MRTDRIKTAARSISWESLIGQVNITRMHASLFLGTNVDMVRFRPWIKPWLQVPGGLYNTICSARPGIRNPSLQVKYSTAPECFFHLGSTRYHVA